jgi:hypothetical protein
VITRKSQNVTSGTGSPRNSASAAFTPRWPTSVGSCAIQPLIAPLSNAAATVGFKLKPNPTNLIAPARPVSSSACNIAIVPGVPDARTPVIAGCFFRSNSACFSSCPATVPL